MAAPGPHGARGSARRLPRGELMTEPYDTDLRAIFRDFAVTASAYIQPPGAAVAQQQARVRVRHRRVLVSLVAAVAGLVPMGIVAAGQLTGSNSLPAPPATQSPTAPTTTTPSPTASPTPTAPPAPTVAARATEGPGELANA